VEESPDPGINGPGGRRIFSQAVGHINQEGGFGMVKSKLSKLFVGLTACLFLLAFGAQAHAAAPDAIKVSAVLSLTGPMADQGVQLKEAYEIFVTKINAAGGVFVKEYGKKLPLDLKVLDDESSGQKTQTQLEAANSWGAVANFGGLGCSSFEMGTPICQKNKMFFLRDGHPHLPEEQDDLDRTGLRRLGASPARESMALLGFHQDPVLFSHGL
jgi:hypothetical protein